MGHRAWRVMLSQVVSDIYYCADKNISIPMGLRVTHACSWKRGFRQSTLFRMVRAGYDIHEHHTLNPWNKTTSIRPISFGWSSSAPIYYPRKVNRMNKMTLVTLCEGNPPVTRNFDVSLVCAWTNGWANNRDAGGLRRHRAHYDVTVMRNSYRLWHTLSNVSWRQPFPCHVFHSAVQIFNEQIHDYHLSWTVAIPLMLLHDNLYSPFIFGILLIITNGLK